MARQLNNMRLGILGGGQLGRMLIQEALNLNVGAWVLDGDGDAPCRMCAEKFVNGSITDFDTVYNFGKTVDLLTVEIEQVNTDALEQLEREGKTVYPQARVLRLIQDKALQKQFFKENDIPTAPFQLVNGRNEIAALHLNYPYVLKTRRDGYDGKGVMMINSAADLTNAFDTPCIAEARVHFEKEVAVIVARNEKGEIAAYPMVDMEFNPEANLVEFLISPSSYAFEVQQRATEIAVKIAAQLKIVGLLAVEMFVTAEGEVLVNELAPRPHNSGHHSIEGNRTSQFAQHLRAILNMPLGATDTLANAVMVNLLGSAGHDGVAVYRNMDKVMAMPGVYPHLYGKKYTKPYRKMGHVTITDVNREVAVARAQEVKNILKVES